MSEKNKVIQLLEGLLEQATVIQLVTAGGRSFKSLDDPTLPVATGVNFVKTQLTALSALDKAEKAAAKSE
jgi:hypothetical protein